MECFSYVREKRIKEILKTYEKKREYNHECSYGTLTLSAGCQYLKSELNAGWIYNLICKYQSLPEMKYLRIQAWTFEQSTVKTHWILSASTGNRQTIHYEFFSYIEFPIRRLEMYYIRGHLCLTSEL